jgi:alkylation response protein AidB-like acyl-CoA dehydrogenase
MTHPIVGVAEDIAERILLPAAIATDAADLAPRSHFDLLAEAGFYGLAGPPETGGLNADPGTVCSVVERLAGGCLTTAFVWIQHRTPVRELRVSKNEALRARCLPELCSGRLRAGIALGGLQAGAAQISATPAEGGWLLDGTAPYVTGWGLIDVVLAAAMTNDGRVLRALVDAGAADGLRVQPLRLLAASASGTVRLTFEHYFVPSERVTSLEAYSPPPSYDGGGRQNGSLALGVARRCLQMLGPGPLDEELNARRKQLDEAPEEEMAGARAAAAEFAVRAAVCLFVHGGSQSLLMDVHPARLYREAAFLLVFGSRPAVRAALLRRLGTPRS